MSQADDVEQKRTELEQHRTAIRSIEAEVRKALAERKKLQSGGLFGLFGGRDPQRLEEVEMTLSVLQVELADRRKQLKEALDAVEQAERRTERVAILPVAENEEQAARMVAATRFLERKLQTLGTMAATAVMGRESHRRPSFGRHNNGYYARNLQRGNMMSVVREQTERWEPILDEAEWLADIVGIPLVLPRRFSSSPRPDAGPRPTTDVDFARRAQTLSGAEEFGLALDVARPAIQSFEMQCVEVREGLLEQFPNAGALAISEDALLVGSSAGESGAAGASDDLSAQWEKLRTCFESIAAVRRKGGSTMDYLDPMGAWQRHANAVRRHPVAIEHDLLPPTNDGSPVDAFVSRLQAEWPPLDARFAEQIERA
jgi:hypothetical protein